MAFSLLLLLTALLLRPTTSANPSHLCDNAAAPSPNLQCCELTGADPSSVPLSCPAGTFTTAGLPAYCTLCPAGTASASGGGTACAACAAGKYSAWPSAGAPLLSRCEDKSVKGCAAGTVYVDGSSFLDDASCASCAPGRYAAQPSLAGCSDCACAAHTVTSCAAGSGLKPGSALADDAKCEACAGSQYSDTSGGGAPCGPHSAPSCPVGQGATLGTATTDVTCAPCGAGKYSDAADGSVCAENTCEAGQYLSSAADEPQVCATACVPGRYAKVGGGCPVCAPGTFSEEAGQASCTGTACVAGKFGKAGQTSLLTATCAPCESGKYADATGKTACTTCAPGTFEPGAQGAAPCGPHSAPSCPAGQGTTPGTATVDTACAACGSGKYSNVTDATACADNTCSKGQYLSSAANESMVCSACAPGRYSATAVAPGAISCAPHSVPSCPRGQEPTPGTASVDVACAPCSSGKYRAMTASSWLKCIDNTCPENQYPSSAASDAQICAACATGRYSQAGAAMCNLIPVPGSSSQDKQERRRNAQDACLVEGSCRCAVLNASWQHTAPWRWNTTAREKDFMGCALCAKKYVDGGLCGEWELSWAYATTGVFQPVAGCEHCVQSLADTCQVQCDPTKRKSGTIALLLATFVAFGFECFYLERYDWGFAKLLLLVVANILTYHVRSYHPPAEAVEIKKSKEVKKHVMRDVRYFCVAILVWVLAWGNAILHVLAIYDIATRGGLSLYDGNGCLTGNVTLSPEMGGSSQYHSPFHGDDGD